MLKTGVSSLNKKQQPMCNCRKCKQSMKPALVDKLHIVALRRRKENTAMKSDLMQWSSKAGTRIHVPDHQSGGNSADHRSLPQKENLISNKKRLGSTNEAQVPIPVISYPTAKQSCYCDNEQQLYLKISIVKLKDEISLKFKKRLILLLKNKVSFLRSTKQSLHRNSKSHFYHGESRESKLFSKCIYCQCFHWNFTSKAGRHANNLSRKNIVIELRLFRNKYQFVLSCMKHETSFKHLAMSRIYVTARKTLFRSYTSKEFKSGTAMEKSFRKTKGSRPCGNQLRLLLNRKPNFTVGNPSSLSKMLWFNSTENVPEERHTKNKQKYSMGTTISTNENCKTNSKKKQQLMRYNHNKKCVIIEVKYFLMNKQTCKYKEIKLERIFSLQCLRKGKAMKGREAALVKGNTLQISKQSKCLTKKNISTSNHGLPPRQSPGIRTKKLSPPSTDTVAGYLSDKLQFKLWESIMNCKNEYITEKRPLFTEVTSKSNNLSPHNNQSSHIAANQLNRCIWCRQWLVSFHRNGHAKHDIVVVERSSWMYVKRAPPQRNSHGDSFFYCAYQMPLLQLIVTTPCSGIRGYVRVLIKHIHLTSNFIFYILLKLIEYLDDFAEIDMMVNYIMLYTLLLNVYKLNILYCTASYIYCIVIFTSLILHLLKLLN